MKISLNELRSKAMKLANQLRKEKGLNKSVSLQQAWQQVKQEHNFQPKSKSKVESILLKPVEEMNTLEQVTTFKELQKLVDEVNAKIEEIKQSLIQELEQQQLQELKIDVFKIRYIEVINKRLDTAKLKTENKNLYEQYLKTVKIKRFTITC